MSLALTALGVATPPGFGKARITVPDVPPLHLGMTGNRLPSNATAAVLGNSFGVGGGSDAALVLGRGEAA